MAIVAKDVLQKSAHKFRKDLVVMPVISAQDTLGHMTARPGTVGKVTVGELAGDMEFGPYKNTRGSEEANFTITPRTLETFLGNCAKKFDPNAVWDTIYGSMVTRGEALKNVDIAQQILFYVTKKLGQKLNMAIWNGVRNPSGDTTKDLFDGFDTIIGKEVEATTISEEKGNLYKFKEAFSTTNAEQLLTEFYMAASEELKGQPTKLYCDHNLIAQYWEDYKNAHGALPYNDKYKRYSLDIAGEMCQLVPLVSKKGSKYMQLTPQSNMLYGYGNGAEKESIGIEKYSSWMLTLEATIFFGVQYESINPEKLLVGEYFAG